MIKKEEIRLYPPSNYLRGVDGKPDPKKGE